MPTDIGASKACHLHDVGMYYLLKRKVLCERLLETRARQSGRSDCIMLRAAYIWGPHSTAYARLVDSRLRQGAPIVLPGATAAEWSHYQDGDFNFRKPVDPEKSLPSATQMIS